MSEITEEQKEVIRELRRRLNGKCRDICPNININSCVWLCEDCVKHFLWIVSRKNSDICPCYCIPFETLDLRFSELLEEPI